MRIPCTSPEYGPGLGILYLPLPPLRVSRQLTGVLLIEASAHKHPERSGTAMHKKIKPAACVDLFSLFSSQRDYKVTWTASESSQLTLSSYLETSHLISRGRGGWWLN